jgi:hypothetical protein
MTGTVTTQRTAPLLCEWVLTIMPPLPSFW